MLNIASINYFMYNLNANEYEKDSLISVSFLEF